VLGRGLAGVMRPLDWLPGGVARGGGRATSRGCDTWDVARCVARASWPRRVSGWRTGHRSCGDRRLREARATRAGYHGVRAL